MVFENWQSENGSESDDMTTCKLFTISSKLYTFSVGDTCGVQSSEWRCVYRRETGRAAAYLLRLIQCLYQVEARVSKCRAFAWRFSSNRPLPYPGKRACLKTSVISVTVSQTTTADYILRHKTTDQRSLHPIAMSRIHLTAYHYLH